MVCFDLLDSPADVVQGRGIFVLASFEVADKHISNPLLEFVEDFDEFGVVHGS